MHPEPAKPLDPPERYDLDLLHLLIRDAHTLYVYWELSSRRRRLVSEHFECDWGAMPKVLRVYDVTYRDFNGQNANGWFDIETTPEADNWYVHGVRANTTYLVDYGTYTLERQFIPLLRSNAAATPRDTEAVWGEPDAFLASEGSKPDTTGRIQPHDFENIQPYVPSRR